MRIMDDDNDKKLDNITLFLTESEARQLLGYVKHLLEEKTSSAHYHLSSEDYQKEVTICIYDPNNINSFHSRIQKLIKDDI